PSDAMCGKVLRGPMSLGLGFALVSVAGDGVMPARGHAGRASSAAPGRTRFLASVAVRKPGKQMPALALSNAAAGGAQEEFRARTATGFRWSNRWMGRMAGATDTERLFAMLGWREGSVYPLWHLLDVRLCWANGGPMGLEPARVLEVAEPTLRMLMGS